MCGIVGVRDDWLRERGSDPAAAMARAVDRLRWRGPDGTGMLRIGPFWLGCARLAISGPRCRQPVARRGGRFAGVMNGAITNARELWAELLPRIAGRAALPNDVWLPLLAVASGRRDLLGRFRGHHAFAVVDAATGELVLRRDRFGEKPLFAARDTSGAIVAFASTPPALAVFGVPPVELEPAAAAFFRRGFAAFAPAAAVAEPLPARALTEARDPGPGLVAGVARCADAAVPVALALSGGIDSSCLAAALAANARRVPAYQFRAAGAEAAEREVARAVATHCGLPFRPVDGGPEVLDPLPHLTRCAGMPLGDPSILAVHALARAAAADGIRVLLGGEGADELFFGYRRYRALRHLPRRRLLGALAPAWSMRYAARWLRAAGSPDPITELLTVAPPGFRRAALAPDVAEPPPRAIAERGAALAARARDEDLDDYLRHDLLPKVDVATMAAGVESRCPFLEVGLAATGVDGALGKRHLRSTFASALPAAVFAQPKRGFALPLDRWFRGELPWLDLLRDRRTLSRQHLRPEGVARAIDRHRRGRADLGHALYLLVAWELHLRHREEESPDDCPGPGHGA